MDFKRCIGLVLAGSVLSIAVSGQQVSELPVPTGSFGIGRTAFQWVDRSRPEVMPDKKSDYRELLVYLFYPTDPKAKGEAAVYFPHLKETEAFEERYGKDSFKNGYGRSYYLLGNLRTHTIENAKIAKGRFPLLIFSHGGGMPVLYYTAIIEELVSHGYVVAAVEHSGDGATVVLPDGRIIAQAGWDEIGQRPKKEKTAFHMSRYKAGAEDDSFILDQLEKLDQGSLPEASKQFKGRFDTGNAGALGHSFGGMLSIFACARDKRFKFCLNLDGGLDEGESYGSPTQPIAAMYGGGVPTRRPGESDEAFAKRKESNKIFQNGVKAPYAGVRKRSYVMFVGTQGFTHFSYFDFPVSQSESGPWSATVEQFSLNKQIIRAFTLAAFDRVLKPKKDDSFDGLLKTYPAVSIDYLNPK
jgi:hypothetical protein